jgi:ketosteroid isomerase-like protein
MSHSNVEVVRRLFELYASGGMDAALEVLDEQLVIVIPPELSAEPDTYHGHEGALRYFEGFDGMLEQIRYEALELFPEGEHVLTHIRLGGRGVSSGLEVDLEAFVVHTVIDGKVMRIVPYADQQSARDALARGAE